MASPEHHSSLTYMIPGAEMSSLTYLLVCSVQFAENPFPMGIAWPALWKPRFGKQARAGGGGVTHHLIAIPIQRRPLQHHPELFPFVA